MKRGSHVSATDEPISFELTSSRSFESATV